MTADRTPEQPTLDEIAAAGARRKRDDERAKKSSADLKALVLAALKAGKDSPTAVTKASGWTAAYVRKMARENGIEPDEKYRERAEKLRTRAAATEES
jgi:hypothetical protein